MIYSGFNIFKSLCCCFYGIELVDICKPQYLAIQTKWRKCIRHTLNLHPWTHNDILPDVIESPRIEHIIYSRILCFFSKGLRHESEYVSFFFRHCLIELQTYMSKNVFCITNRVEVIINDLYTKSEQWIKRKCKPVAVQSWKSTLVKELLLRREGALNTNLSNDEITEILTEKCIS